MSLFALSGSRLRSAAIVSLRTARRYAAIASLGVTLVPLVSLAASANRPSANRPSANRSSANRVAPASPIPLAALASRPVHDLHLTFSRAEVNGSRIRWRVRLFRDDLEKTLQSYARRASLSAESSAADSVFENYFNARVRIAAGGTTLRARVLESGRDPDSPDQQMWWYQLEVDGKAPFHTLSVTVRLLFEHFADQRNIVTVTREPGGQRRSLYFARGDSADRTVF